MMRTYPNYGVQLRHRDLFRPINSGRHLLLMLLRQKGQDLSDDRVQSLRYFGLQQKRRVSRPPVNATNISISDFPPPFLF